MKKKDESELRDKYLNHTYNQLTIIDIVYQDKKWLCKCLCKCGNMCVKHLNKVVSNHTKTCGSSVHKKEQGIAHSQYYKDHSNVAIEASGKIKKWYRDNQDRVIERSISHQEWWHQNKNRLPEISLEHKQTLQSKRLVPSYNSLLEIIHPKYKDALLSGKISRDDIIETKCPKCGNYGSHSFHNTFKISTDSLKYSSAPLCERCRCSITSSKPEQEIANYIASFYKVEPIRNCRTILNNKELDLFYSEKNIAIEFNGDYWHSEVHKAKDYHIDKFKLCKERNVLLVSIFESEWNNYKEVIKKYLVDLFNGLENELSFSNGLMSNNYPSPLKYLDATEYIEDYYLFKDHKVYTCGFSVIRHT